MKKQDKSGVNINQYKRYNTKLIFIFLLISSLESNTGKATYNQ